MKNKIKTIAFDADDTLWVNETYFQNIEERFCLMFSDYFSKEFILSTLLEIELKNLPLYGFGVRRVCGSYSF